eukprot:TRINITY_DN5901_c0_g2_i1.p2 TRINITY_DN5901_c0_g2~~TRINITY_DN5901_c0_g2_i1.p2  ORF type:complete len:157 (-),score=11.45 TRINITY_DN5901_c0_g2_i1:341-811(-)
MATTEKIQKLELKTRLQGTQQPANSQHNQRQRTIQEMLVVRIFVEGYRASQRKLERQKCYKKQQVEHQIAPIQLKCKDSSQRYCSMKNNLQRTEFVVLPGSSENDFYTDDFYFCPQFSHPKKLPQLTFYDITKAREKIAIKKQKKLAQYACIIGED